MDLAKQYNRAKRLSSILSLFIFIVYLLFGILSGVFREIADVSGLLTVNKYIAYVLFAAILFGGIKLLLLPLDFYSDFILEHRFNLSNQTIGSWALLELKGILISILIGVPALLLILFVFRNAILWWFWAGLALFLFSMVLSQLAPVLLFPLFYKFVPLKDQELALRLKKLGESQGFRISDIYSFDMSRDTVKANAALTGLFGTRRIIISDTLISKLSNDEIASVFAHELGHARLKHIPLMIFSGGINIFLGLYVVSNIFTWLLACSIGQFTDISDPAALPLFVLLMLVFGMITHPVNNIVSRWAEKRADLFAINLMGNSLALISGLKKLGEQNMAEEEPHPLVEWYLFSHPPLKKRLALLQTNDIKE